ncbi:uncharacterized protein LOC134258978 [Saccostrea cucullata]|uniref:uncharacterized protein LOC134258978 n=1 Tax=Saccostrea cuccullata TaxID=36930 RepID=UPI002ED0D4EC
MSVACLAFFATGCVFFVAALITCLCVKRQFSGKRYDKYVQDSRSLGESASQIYTRMEENVYQECEQTSTIYNDSTNSSCLSQYDRSHLLERIKENKAKPSILSLLRWKKRCSGKTLAKSGYIYVIGSQEHLTESASGSGEAPLRLRVIPEPPTQPMLPLPLSSSHIATATVPT